MIIGFINLKGGVGKSTLCINVAGVLADRGNKVGIIDIDPQETTKDWYGRRLKIERNNLLPIHVVSVDTGRSWPIQRQLRDKTKSYDFILIDGAAGDRHISSAALNVCDKIILPMSPSESDFGGTKRTVNFFHRPSNRVKRLPPRRVVINSAKTTTNIAGEYSNDKVPNAWPDNYFTGQVGNQVAFEEAMKDGLTVLETPRSRQAVDDINRLTDAIIRAW